MIEKTKFFMKKNWNHVHVVISFIILLFPLAFTKEPHIMNDTVEYVGFFSYLPPLYPFFLRVLLFVFGEKMYLWIAVILQTMLAAIVIVRLISLISDCYNIQGLWKEIMYCGLILSYYLMDTQLCTNLWIATEGLSLSLFYIVVICTIKYLIRRNIGTYINLLVWTTVLTWCRSQFICCYLMIFLYLIGQLVFKYISVKRLLLSIFLLGIAFVSMQFGCRVYKHFAVNKFEETYVYQTVGKHLMYYASAEDAEHIEDPDERELFLFILDEIKASGYASDVKGRSLVDSAYDYKNYFEHYYAYMGHITEYVMKRHPNANDVEINHEMALVMEHQNEAMKKHIPRWIINSLSQFLPSLGNSVALYTRDYGVPIIIYSLIVICIYIALAIRIIFLKHRLTKEVVFAIVVFIYMIGNALYTNLAVAYMMRYVSYVTAIFYIAFILMFFEILSDKQKY